MTTNRRRWVRACRPRHHPARIGASDARDVSRVPNRDTPPPFPATRASSVPPPYTQPASSTLQREHQHGFLVFYPSSPWRLLISNSKFAAWAPATSAGRPWLSSPPTVLTSRSVDPNSAHFRPPSGQRPHVCTRHGGRGPTTFVAAASPTPIDAAINPPRAARLHPAHRSLAHETNAKHPPR